MRPISQCRELDTRSVLGKRAQIFKRPREEQDDAAASERASAQRNRLQLERAQHHHGKCHGPADAIDHGPQRIAAKAVEQQRKYAGGDQEDPAP